MPRPQRDLELEAAVGIAQLVAEQILHLTQPVPDGLRVHVHMLRHLVGVTAGLEPGQQRLGQPILLGRSSLSGRSRARDIREHERQLAGRVTDSR
jgi:hypothetical protein